MTRKFPLVQITSCALPLWPCPPVPLLFPFLLSTLESVHTLSLSFVAERWGQCMSHFQKLLMIFQGHWMISSLKQKKSYHLLHILLNDNIHAKTAGEMAKLFTGAPQIAAGRPWKLYYRD